MAGRDVLDSGAEFIGGSASALNFIIGTGQHIGPFRVSGRDVTIQISTRKNYTTGALPTVANIVVEGSLDKMNWYPIAGPTVGTLGIFTFQCIVPWIRVSGDFGGNQGSIYVYSIR